MMHSQVSEEGPFNQGMRMQPLLHTGVSVKNKIKNLE